MKLAVRLPAATALAWGWLGLLLLAGVLGPWLPLPFNAIDPDLAHLATPPSWADAQPHYLGTDPLGRDVLAGLVAGARRLLLLSLPATALATATGALLGGAAGYWGNRGLQVPLLLLLAALAAAGLAWQLPWWLVAGAAVGLAVAAARRRWQLALPLDSLVLGLTVLLGAVPRLILLLVLASALPPGQVWLPALLALLAWPDTARLVRTHMQRVRVSPFVEAAQALGLPPSRIWWRHALPAACQPLRALAPLTLAALIGLENTLTFLGVSVGSQAVGWGELLGELRQEPTAWWLVAGPGAALLATLLALQQLARQTAR